jgi:SNF2 family DNA or RNA helicase
VKPDPAEREFYHLLDSYLRWRTAELRVAKRSALPSEPPDNDEDREAMPASIAGPRGLPPMTRMQVNTMLMAAGSHPAAMIETLERTAEQDERVLPILQRARCIQRSAKERRLLELIGAGKPSDKILVFASFRTTIERLKSLFSGAGIAFSVFSGAESALQKDHAVYRLQHEVPVMLCSESGGEGRNLQFANVLINYDLPWNPMRIEQRVGRIHRIGQRREVFIFNLCTAGSIEERILLLLNDKIRMFELVVGEAGAILGNLHGGDEFETLVLDMWLRSQSQDELNQEFERLGESLVQAQKEYLSAKQLDEALFGEDYE